MNREQAQGRVGCVLLLCASWVGLFGLLRASGVISWSWWAVTAPLTVPLAVGLILIGVTMLTVGVVSVTQWFGDRRLVKRRLREIEREPPDSEAARTP